MATRIHDGQIDWRVARDEEGHREYKIRFLIESTNPLDGPAAVLRTPGLPVNGYPWFVDNDIDLWAWFRPTCTVTPLITDKVEPVYWWVWEGTASTKPPSREKQRCHELEWESPLLEPPKISGSFVKQKKEASRDKDGNLIRNSAWEQIRGPQVEFDASTPTIKIEQNVPVLQLALFASMIDTVNSVPLWGLPVRCVKLSNVSWERLFYGLCYLYYKRTLEFDINYNTFDRTLPDEGTKVIIGRWDTDETSATYGDYLPDVGRNADNPKDFKRYKDFHNENARVILNGGGRPYDEDSAGTDNQIGTRTIQYYQESNPIVLGIPLTF